MKNFKVWISKHRKIVLAVIIFLTIYISVSGGVVQFSDSMAPAIRKGDLVHYEKVPYEQLKIGDVIIFNVPDFQYPLMHRIYNKTDSSVVTKGDNNPASDKGRWGLITPDKIIGRATFVIPLIGYIFIITADVVGLSLNNIISILIFLIISYILSYLIVQIYDRSRKPKK